MKHNDDNNHNNKVSVKWQLFKYLAVFTVLILVILWLCQVVFLDSIYKLINISNIKFTAKEITENLDSIDFHKKAEKLAVRNEMCILVLKMVDINTAVELLSIDTLSDCAIHNTDKSSKFVLYDSAKANGGNLLQRFRYDSVLKRYYSVENPVTSDINDYEESIVYTVIAENNNGDNILIILNSIISPVGATINTLNTMLIYISVALLLLSLMLAFIIFKRVSKPIMNINNSAKILAEGNYDVKFDGSGYREISELSDTLNYAAAELSKVDNLRRELIANISHDLRTPLTMIGGYSEVMRDIPGENTPENIQIIIDETKRLTSLVNDVLDISKLQSGVQKFDLIELNITVAIKKALTRYNKLTEQEGYTIDFQYKEEINVKTDETRIMQVIYNLVNNAVTYTGDDKHVIVRQTVKDNWVRICVIDSGEGIPADKLSNIWDRYYKVDKVHRRASVGTGLGLSIVKSIVDANNGKYGVESEVGKGSEFWIELPICNNNCGILNSPDHIG